MRINLFGILYNHREVCNSMFVNYADGIFTKEEYNAFVEDEYQKVIKKMEEFPFYNSSTSSTKNIDDLNPILLCSVITSFLCSAYNEYLQRTKSDENTPLDIFELHVALNYLIDYYFEKELKRVDSTLNKHLEIDDTIEMSPYHEFVNAELSHYIMERVHAKEDDKPAPSTSTSEPVVEENKEEIDFIKAAEELNELSLKEDNKVTVQKEQKMLI